MMLCNDPMDAKKMISSRRQRMDNKAMGGVDRL